MGEKVRGAEGTESWTEEAEGAEELEELARLAKRLELRGHVKHVSKHDRTADEEREKEGEGEEAVAEEEVTSVEGVEGIGHLG